MGDRAGSWLRESRLAPIPLHEARLQARRPERITGTPRFDELPCKLWVLKSLVRPIPGVPKCPMCRAGRCWRPVRLKNSSTSPRVGSGTPRPGRPGDTGPSVMVPCHTEGSIVFGENFRALQENFRRYPQKRLLGFTSVRAPSGRSGRRGSRSGARGRRTSHIRCRCRTWRTVRSQSAGRS